MAMFHYMLNKAEFVTLVRSKVPSGSLPSSYFFFVVVVLTHRAYLLPYLVASCLLLEAERQVEVVPLRPDDQRLLLLLVGRVHLDLGLQQQRA